MTTSEARRPAIACATVLASAVRIGLDRLTEIAGPLRVRVGLGDGALRVTTHGAGPWWATSTVLAVAGPTETAAAWVPRLDFGQAVDAEALLVPDATCSITVVQDDVVRYGGFAFPASNPPDLAPPRLGGAIVTIPTADLGGGRHELSDGRVVEVPTSSLERFRARSIESVDLVECDSSHYVVGYDTKVADTDITLIAHASVAGAGST